MKVAVFGTSLSKRFFPVLDEFFGFLKTNKIEVQLFRPFYNFLKNELNIVPYYTTFFQSPSDFDNTNQFIFSVGGDGTFLHSVVNIRNFDIPVVGVNSGRLGFLADISQEQVQGALTDIFNDRYSVVERSLLEVDFCGRKNLNFNFALNELAVLKTDSSSMINISARCGNNLLNNYWSDGLIVATPTGSTAYSLSVGGPILTPDSENFVITPLAPHNLTIRPVVVPDKYEIELKVEGRGSHYLTSLDYRSEAVELSTTLKIRKAKVTLKTLQLPDQDFFNTLRNKLMWGADKRN
ncbi:NAD kinase [Mariniphaga sediminis]|jgi:NAD+ kinase|uniref:NAD kinase n=1 Tax=Mariniphaga sediminis TaxID=1628158 RepID=A0A399D5Y8_9BACT|nr:NAD kinase [Mariniphaga sediminis]RIH66803.1 NAD kinase [Mariniphaga sediminis]